MKRNAITVAVLVAAAIGGLATSKLVAQVGTDTSSLCSYPTEFQCPASWTCDTDTSCVTTENPGNWIMCLPALPGSLCIAPRNIYCEGIRPLGRGCPCYPSGSCP